MKSIGWSLPRNTCFIHRVQLLISRVDSPRRTTSSFVSFFRVCVSSPRSRSFRGIQTRLYGSYVASSAFEACVNSYTNDNVDYAQRERNKSRIFRKSGQLFVFFSFRSMLGFSIPSIKTRIRGENCFSVISLIFPRWNSVLFLSDVSMFRINLKIRMYGTCRFIR